MFDLDEGKEERERRYRDTEVLQFGNLIISTPARCVEISGQAVPLTVKEFDLLVTLASAPERVFTRAALLELVWDYTYPGKSRTVDVHIAALRKKLEIVAEVPHYIQTVWGLGYKFRALPSHTMCGRERAMKERPFYERIVL